MCGKFNQHVSWRELNVLPEGYEDFVPQEAANDPLVTFTPMHPVPVVYRFNGRRRVAPMVWSFTNRAAAGRRSPKHMHARGETVDRLPTFAESFATRRGVTFVQSFNEGEEIPLKYADGGDAGRNWTRQWVFERRDRKPAIIGVIWEAFNASPEAPREAEFVQVTTEANAMIAAITDRMPLILAPEDLPLWLGETEASLEEIRGLIRPQVFDPALWQMRIESPEKKPPVPRRKKPENRPA